MHPFLTADRFLSLPKESLLSDLDDFYGNIYSRSPLDSNKGGMGLESSFWVWLIAKTLRPVSVVESGVWKGFTTWLFDNIEPISKIYCFDPAVADPGFISHKSKKAIYFAEDWASTKFSFVNSGETLFFFDDHQDHLERLVLSYLRGAEYVLLDDNYFWGGGGHSGLADYMRCNDPILQVIARQIYICPPLVGVNGRNYGMEPLFNFSDFSENLALTHCEREDNFNWLTLVQLNRPARTSLSQAPDADYIIQHFSSLP